MTNKAKAENLFIRADRADEQGQSRRAFRLMLAAAKLGDQGAQTNVGNYYADGKGVRRNRSAALYWYKRAYRGGEACAASNIGVLYRNEGEPNRALAWFKRAVAAGDDEANLDIGKHYLQNDNPRRAVPYFKRVRPTGFVTEAGVEEARRLLKSAEGTLRRKPRPRA
jgi:uncharacterized protein